MNNRSQSLEAAVVKEEEDMDEIIDALNETEGIHEEGKTQIAHQGGLQVSDLHVCSAHDQSGNKVQQRDNKPTAEMYLSTDSVADRLTTEPEIETKRGAVMETSRPGGKNTPINRSGNIVRNRVEDRLCGAADAEELKTNQAAVEEQEDTSWKLEDLCEVGKDETKEEEWRENCEEDEDEGCSSSQLVASINQEVWLRSRHIDTAFKCTDHLTLSRLQDLQKKVLKAQVWIVVSINNQSSHSVC